MKSYEIEITETLQKRIEVKADNYKDALNAVKKLYKDGDIILDSDDFVDTEIKLVEETIERENTMYIDNKKVEYLRKEYPVGTKIKLIKMDDPYHPVPPNSIGEVTCVDDMGTIHMSWENGSSLGLVHGEDSFIKIDALKKNKSKEEVR